MNYSSATELIISSFYITQLDTTPWCRSSTTHCSTWWPSKACRQPATPTWWPGSQVTPVLYN